MMKKFFSLIIILTITGSSCVKKKLESDNETSSSIENFTATQISNDIAGISDEAGRNGNISGYRTESNSQYLSTCATLKFDTISKSNPDSITVDFGNNNCLCNDGKYRRGKLLITYTGKYRDSANTITVQPLNYFVNDYNVSGKKSITNKGHNSFKHLVYAINVNFTITKPGNEGKFTFISNREREWLTGENTLIWSDDKYSITGDASGTNSNGRSYTSLITKPLLKEMTIGCRKQFTSGTIVHMPQNKPKRTIDFGNGECDYKATVTINGTTYTVTLP